MPKTRAGRLVQAGLAVALPVVWPMADSGSSSFSLTLPAPVAVQRESAADRETLLPVDLPDLSPMAETVQQQLGEQYESLTRAMAARPPSGALAAAYGEMGKLLMAAEAFAQAEPYFLNAHSLAPGEMRWPYYLGHLYRFQGRSRESADFFERALRLQPDASAALVWLGDVYLDQGRVDLAEPLFDRALSLAPGLFAAQFGLGRAALARRDYVQAVERLEAALALDGSATIVHYPLALAYRALGQLDEAAAHLRRRGDVDAGPPDPLMQEIAGLLRSAVVWEGRGDRAIASGEFSAATEAFRQALALAPERPALKQKLATALVLTGDMPTAVALYQELLQENPDFAEARYSLGVLLEGSGRDDLAIAQYTDAVRADPTYLQARLRLADVLRRNGQADAALRRYREVLALDPRVGEARFGYALALVRLERYQAAREALDEGVRTYPGRPEFVGALARLLAAAPDDAVRDGSRALELSERLLRGLQTNAPSNVGARETMAMALAETGQYDQAARWQQEAIAAAGQAGRVDALAPMAEVLELYRTGQPGRTPWREDPVWGSGE